MKLKRYLLIILSLILVFSIAAFGNEAIEKVEAYLVSDLNFEVDGDSWSPKDVDGSPLTPLNYNGRTYVPVRSLLEDKGVTVGYEAETRTVLLDYSTIKHIDKASPLLMTVASDVDADADADGIDDLTIEKNPNSDLGNINFKQEITLEISEDGKVYAWGQNRMRELSLKELALSDEAITTEKINFEIDEETGMVTSMELYQSEEKDRLADDFHITIRITRDPFTIHIIIEW